MILLTQGLLLVTLLILPCPLLTMSRVLSLDLVFFFVLFQLVDLPDHLEKAEADIKEKIPDQNYSGLAVIDWEPWRPLWERNWNAKKIYKIKSIELMRARHPDWPMAKLVDEAQSEFETAARTLFEETIKLGKKLRPKAYWGFYGFPDCFGQEKHHYQCTEEVRLIHLNKEIALFII